MKKERFQSDRVLAYFKLEWKVLLLITVSGLIYNLGLLAGPWFEGKMTGCLVEILKEKRDAAAMLRLVLGYVAAIAVVQPPDEAGALPEPCHEEPGQLKGRG